MPRPISPFASPLEPERVAYWYFRLNGFLQIENFVVHPENREGQRTDADLLGVRFRHRAERAFDGGKPMVDDAALNLSVRYDEVVIVEVKTNQPCTLNGPWTKPERKNVHRVLAAIGCLRNRDIAEAADGIYDDGVAIFGRTRIRLVAVGRDRDPELNNRYREVLQLTWNEILGFIWDRFLAFREQKRDVDQWDDAGQALRRLAGQNDRGAFIGETGRLMGLTQIR